MTEPDFHGPVLALRMTAFSVSLLLFAVVAPASTPAVGPDAVRRSLSQAASPGSVGQGTGGSAPRAPGIL